MLFLAFDLSSFSSSSDSAMKMRIVEHRNFESAKEFVSTCFPGTWAIVPKKLFDRGIVQNILERKETA